MAYTAVYVHEVIGVPGSEVGHLPAPWGVHRRTLCGGDAIERALARVVETNEALWRDDLLDADGDDE